MKAMFEWLRGWVAFFRLLLTNKEAGDLMLWHVYAAMIEVLLRDHTEKLGEPFVSEMRVLLSDLRARIERAEQRPWVNVPIDRVREAIMSEGAEKMRAAEARLEEAKERLRQQVQEAKRLAELQNAAATMGWSRANRKEDKPS